VQLEELSGTDDLRDARDAGLRTFSPFARTVLLILMNSLMVVESLNEHSVRSTTTLECAAACSSACASESCDRRSCSPRMLTYATPWAWRETDTRPGGGPPLDVESSVLRAMEHPSSMRIPLTHDA
jgi:hypothetical protein